MKQRERIVCRLAIALAVGFAALLAGCGSSVSSSAKPGSKQVFSVNIAPVQLTLNSGDFSKIAATVDLSTDNSDPAPISPQPEIKYSSSDPRVTISPSGEVCAGQWDSRFITCSPTATLPTGYVNITASNASHNVSASIPLSVHVRAARITLTAPNWAGRLCISQNTPVGAPATSSSQVQYVATAVDASGNPVGNVFDNDYTWTTDNSVVAAVSTFGSVIARNPGVTNIYATLNGTVSEPLAFVTCPPSSIVLSTSNFTGTNPTAPFTTDDLTLNKGDRKYVNATLRDVNGNPLIDSPLTYITSDPLTGSLTSALALSAKLTANTAGGFTMMASCEPASCNPSVADFVSPAGPESGQAVGFGFPIYSNVIGATVQGTTGSSVLVTGTLLSDGVTPAHRLLVLDSESLTQTQTVEVANLPNSLVVAPNGAKAYLGSSDGLVVVDLGSFQSTLREFPVTGQPATAVVTGTVLGVSPDSRFVLVSDVAHGEVFLIDTTGTKAAALYRIPNITSVTFAADGSNIWIGGDAGVFVFQADTFVPVPHNFSSHVTSLAWMPDGQSYFASGDQTIDYSTCENRNPQPAPGGLVSTVLGGLNTTAIGGEPRVLGLDAGQWFDYSVTTSAQVGSQTVNLLSALTPNGTGNVCLSTVTVNPPVTAAATLPCNARQLSFSPRLEQQFITGVDPACGTAESVLHGYDAVAQTAFSLATTNPVVPLGGGVLSDGRKLYFGSFDSTNGAVLHRIDLATSTGTPGTRAEDDSAAVGVVPSFVAVVPR